MGSSQWPTSYPMAMNIFFVQIVALSYALKIKLVVCLLLTQPGRLTLWGVIFSSKAAYLSDSTLWAVSKAGGTACQRERLTSARFHFQSILKGWICCQDLSAHLFLLCLGMKDCLARLPAESLDCKEWCLDHTGNTGCSDMYPLLVEDWIFLCGESSFSNGLIWSYSLVGKISLMSAQLPFIVSFTVMQKKY